MIQVTLVMKGDATQVTHAFRSAIESLIGMATRIARACIPCRGTGKLVTRFDVYPITRHDTVSKLAYGSAVRRDDCTACAGIRAVIARAEQSL